MRSNRSARAGAGRQAPGHDPESGAGEDSVPGEDSARGAGSDSASGAAGVSAPGAGSDPGIGLALRLERELDALSADVAGSLREQIGPQLTALRALVASLESRLSASEPALAPLAAVLLGQADALIESVRELIRRTRPDALSCGGLPEALRALAADWRLRRPGCRVELMLDPPDESRFGLTSPVIESAALQAAAAACERAFGMGAASGVVLAVSRTGQRLLLQIEHDGRGPGAAGLRDGIPAWFGSAQARVAALGGQVQVEPGQSGGTSIVVRLPWAGVRAGGGDAASPL